MKSFGQLLKEAQDKEVHHVMAFGRMNPPTTGHLKLIDKVKSVAQKVGGKHTVIVSHSQDTKKNPLSGEQKVKHLKRYSPGTNFKASSKTLLPAAYITLPTCFCTPRVPRCLEIISHDYLASNTWRGMIIDNITCVGYLPMAHYPLQLQASIT